MGTTPWDPAAGDHETPISEPPPIPALTYPPDETRVPLAFGNQVFVGHPAESSAPCSATLQFMSFLNNGYVFTALIDTGAQLNLLGEDLLAHMEYEQIEGRSQNIRGIQGHETRIRQWVKLQIELTNQDVVTAPFAVMKELAGVVIIGRPLLVQLGAIIDMQLNIMETTKGPIPLTECSTMATSRISTVVDPTQQLEAAVRLGALAEPEKDQVLRVLQQFSSIWDPNYRGRVSGISHEIRLKNDRPIKQRPRRYGEEHQEVIETEIEDMLKEKVIRPSKSPYSSEIVLARKKGGKWRVCIDFRDINRATIDDNYPLPRIDDLLHSVRDSKYFVALDLKAGYWQIPMEESSIPYTAFRCHKGLYEFVVMPFGLKNAPATFQRLMDFLLGDLKHEGALVYLDDILVHGPTFEGTLTLLETVLHRLEVAGLRVNIEKCSFFPGKVHYLGQVIENGRMYPDPARVEALRNLTHPSNVHDVRSVLGVLGYYRSYIRNFADLMRPVTDLLKGITKQKGRGKRAPIHWTQQHQEAIDEAVRRIQEAVLFLPLSSGIFLLETDASDTAISAILSCKQPTGEWGPVEFASKKLTDTERRWPVREREAYAIVFGLIKFDHFLRGREFTVHTDHESLKWMLEASTGKISRWASRMAEYNMRIIHKKGTSMVPADFFSRFVDDNPDPDLQPRMVFTGVRSATVIPTMEAIIEAQKAADRPCGKGFYAQDDKIYYHNALWVPPLLRVQIIEACHNTAPFLHPGIKKTVRMISRVFNWPCLHQDVARYIRGCLICQRIRGGPERLQGLLRTNPVPGPFHTVHMDFWACTYQHRPHRVLTMIDQLTKWAECTPIGQQTEEVAASAMIKGWISRFGVPRILVTDSDPSFTGKLFQEICARLGIRSLQTTPYHPQGNGAIESFHRVLRRGLSYFDHDATIFVPFDEALQLTLFGYRCTPHTTTHETPAWLALGVDPQIALDGDWRTIRDYRSTDRLRFLNDMRLDIQYQAQIVRLQNNEKTNERRRDAEFKENRLILTRIRPYEAAAMIHTDGMGRKLLPLWSVPYRVISVCPGGQSAYARNLVTGRSRKIHVSDARVIAPPLSEKQVQEWETSISKDLGSMMDPKIKAQRLQAFWREVPRPQLLSIPHPSATGSAGDG